MKQSAILGLALALLLGLAVSASHAAKPKKAKTEAEVESYRFVGPDLAEIYGDVHSKRSKCEKGRNVTLVRRSLDSGDDVVIGTDTTDGTGDWEVRIAESDFFIGNYAVEVERKKIRKGEKTLTCKATTSPDKLFA